MSFLRLYLVPTAQQLVVDVDLNDLVLSDGKFVNPQLAPSVTLTQPPANATFTPFGSAEPVSLQLNQELQARVCWREIVDTQEYPAPIEVTDPSGGECVCLVTCQGTNITYVQVTAVS